MRDPETAHLLQAVQSAVIEARQGGVTVRACIWDATAAAVDGEPTPWPSPEARRTADNACRAVDPPRARANPEPRPEPPLLARWLFATADWVARRAAA
jgi:hypothetical protein